MTFRWFSHFFRPNTLMFKLFVVMGINIVIPMLLIGSISFYSIYSILQNKVEKGVQTNLKEMVQGLQTSLDNLGYASRQLTLDGDIGRRLQQYLNPTLSNIEKVEIQSDIESRLNLISYANQGLGAMFYFMPGQNRTLFETMLIKNDADPMAFPLLASDPLTLYQGPHPSIYQYSNDTVFSIVQEMVGNPNIPKTYVYIETNYKVFHDLLTKNNFGYKVRYMILDPGRHVLYSEVGDSYPVGSVMPAVKDSGNGGAVSRGSLEMFEESGAGGWSIIATASRKDLNGEVSSWAVKYALIATFSFALCTVLAWLIWRFINRKLLLLKQEIKLTEEYHFDHPITPVHVVEFDDLILRFHGMRTRIVELLEEVEQKEKNKRKLEVQKLKYQINPHFIHNTLNTIQWIARIHKQEEIVSLISIFTRILHYNLGKEGDVVTIREEMEALQDYVSLQRIRYNYHFQVHFDVDEDAQDLSIVRFLIQPLVENAMYHGFSEDDGTITVRIKRIPQEHVRIEVEDNGQGMDEETLHKILSGSEDTDSRKSGMGIGLSFVNRTLIEYFGEDYGLRIESELHAGTKISMRIPNGLFGNVKEEDK